MPNGPLAGFPGLLLGYDVGGSKSAAVLALPDGRIVDRTQWESKVEIGPERMIARFLAAANDLMSRHGGCSRVGVSIGGPMDARRGVILSPPHLPGWDGIPLAEMLSKEYGVSVTVEHDAAACLEAEVLWGAAAGTTHAAYLTCGTGCGAGLMIDGRIVRGPDGQSPELGHVRLAPDGPEVFGKRGCVESFCSGEGISKLAPYLFPRRWSERVDTQELFRLHRQGDVDASTVLAESARRTGQFCAILADTFAPQVIVLGSLARYFGSGWVDQVRQEFARESLPIRATETRTVPAALAERLQDLSCVAPCVFQSPVQE